jgi:SAM-dependent methyltransferase
MTTKLERHRDIWRQKKIIRVIYSGWYKKIINDLAGNRGKTIELGGGSGNFKEFRPGVITSDIEPCRWLDTCFDAHWMPFKDRAAGNIVMIDVLHHLADPVGFLQEAQRVLAKGGRLVMLEPFPTPFSLFIYKRFHQEPFIMDADYFDRPEDGIKDSNMPKDPWEANQAAAYLLFFKHYKKFLRIFGGTFKIIKRKTMSCILYPASGGLENKAKIPNALIPVFKFLEILLMPFRRLLAFRCYIVLEKI